MLVGTDGLTRQPCSSAMPTKASTRSPRVVKPSVDEIEVLYVACYDICDDRRRAALRRMLSGYGEPVQFSIFVCWLDHRALRELRRQIGAVTLDPGDQVELFRCIGDASQRIVGTAPWWIV